MLHLLIAIISDIYAVVEANSENGLYRDLSDLIIENSFLVPDSKIHEHDHQGDYLYIGKLEKSEA